MLGERNFPDFIEAYLKYSAGHESTKKIHMWTVISIIAGALERKVWMDRGYYTLWANLYIFIIGKSGLIKKSTSTSIGIDLLRELPNVKFMSERLTSASLIDQMSCAYKTFEFKDQNVKHSSVYAYASELSILMMEVHGTIIELLTTFYDCQPNDANKPWVYKTRSMEPQLIYGPCLNLFGASTPTWLEKCIPQDEMEGGFTGRCIFVVENKGPEKYVAWPEYTEEAKNMKGKLIEDLMFINELQGQVIIHSKTKEYFTKWYEHHMEYVVKPNKDPRYIGYLSRKGDIILKLAMIRSVSMREDLYILPNHLEWASKILQATEKEMFSTFDGVKERRQRGRPKSRPRNDERPEDITTKLKIINNFNVYNFVKEYKKVSVQQIRDHFNVKKGGGPLGECLSELIEMHKIDFSMKDHTQYFSSNPTYEEKMTNSF